MVCVIAGEPGVSDIALNGSVVIIDDVPEFSVEAELPTKASASRR